MVMLREIFVGNEGREEGVVYLYSRQQVSGWLILSRLRFLNIFVMEGWVLVKCRIQERIPMEIYPVCHVRSEWV